MLLANLVADVPSTTSLRALEDSLLRPCPHLLTPLDCGWGLRARLAVCGGSRVIAADFFDSPTDHAHDTRNAKDAKLHQPADAA